MIDQCSIWSYDEMKTSGQLSKMLAEVLSVIIESKAPLQAANIRFFYEQRFKKGLSRNAVCSKLVFLRQGGFIEKAGHEFDPITKRNVNVWRYTGRKEAKGEETFRIKCPRCNGKGKIIQKIAVENSGQMDFLK